MTKDVLVTVKGKQIADDHEEEIEVINVGSYYERNGKIYIRYEEQMEGTDAVVLNMIKIDGDGIEITKKGSVGAQMIFRENEKINSCYDTPYGMLMMAVYTNRIQCSMEQDKIEINVLYSIEMNGELLSDADVYIKVESRGLKELNLM